MKVIYLVMFDYNYNMNNFIKLNLHDKLLKVIQELEYDNPTSIQKKVIPLVLKGVDVIAGSKSGTGKTAAFVLPIIQKLYKIIKPDNKVPRALIIAPTSELVSQISHAIEIYTKYFEIKNISITGGVPKNKQIEILNQGVDIIVASPGRLIELSKERKVDLSSVSTIVLDEADSMLDNDFIEQVTFLLTLCAKQRQIMMFSATISQNIKKLAKEFMYEPISVEVSQRRDVVNAINHFSYKVDKKRKLELLSKIIRSKGNNQVMVFVGSKEEANEVNSYMFSKSIRSSVVHSDIKKNDRLKAFTIFRNKKVQVLITTDISARGIDIKELPLVINYSLPTTTDEFTHRSGRTGRANKSGNVITLLTVDDYNLFTKIEIHLKLSIKREIYKGFDLEDRQPRQKQTKKKSLREKKGFVDYKKNRRNKAMLDRQRKQNKERN
jgi:ATP-dependent RNA helicase RhlE